MAICSASNTRNSRLNHVNAVAIVRVTSPTATNAVLADLPSSRSAISFRCAAFGTAPPDRMSVRASRVVTPAVMPLRRSATYSFHSLSVIAAGPLTTT